MTKPFSERFPGLLMHIIDERNPAYAQTQAPESEPARREPERCWKTDFDAAVKRHMAPAENSFDTFTDSAIDAALPACEDDLRAVAPVCACGAGRPVVTPLTATGRWWLAIKRWWRIPRAVVVALLLIAGFALLFTFAPLIELTGGGK